MNYKILKHSEIWESDSEKVIASRIADNFPFKEIKFESTSLDGITVFVYHKHLISGEIIQRIDHEMSKLNLKVKIVDNYPYEYLNPTVKEKGLDCLTLYIETITGTESIYMGLDKKNRNIIRAFFLIRFGKIPEDDYGYFLSLVERYHKYGIFSDYWDSTSKKVLYDLTQLYDQIRSK